MDDIEHRSEGEDFIYKIEATKKPKADAPEIVNYFIAAREINASDIYFSVDECPVLKRHGKFYKLLESPFYRSEELKQLVYGILNKSQIQQFEKRLDMELMYVSDYTGSIRINLYHAQDGIGAACRIIPRKIPELHDIGPKESLEKIAELDDGLVLITGEARSGKSTTLASIVEHININKKKFIVTIEDIIEFHHANQSSLIEQRQVGVHTLEFSNAINAAIRSKADVIILTDVQCKDAINLAMNAAEAGTLVIAVMRTFGGSGEAIFRMLNYYSEGEQRYARYQLSRVLRSIIWQHLLPLKDFKGTVPAMEILHNTKKISELIRTNQLEKINKEVGKGSAFGMQTMEQSFDFLKTVHELEENVSLAFRYGKYLLALL
ncbi:type IV pilus twitching motility protein PilT [Candidatus Magnetominusculus xianensis]|uniref:Type IV pili twitching motility protein PilT n=1 Tax=Candidatus Magnetominusculus xianensis TaxID=1748249 RepID=A0ABR5SBR9_9BACT|nr:ATPase, T2SS/T4P/T4SS family [Candidatus Magnetominusculus xianensis]KWT78267.1 type IV pili twitching motility protein PilT [Candidatus Magnetominusculus xianensis]MBF0404045.1 Flp pilus assembly complex ATPase component TadA [Nitrospirota bacterium]